MILFNIISIHGVVPDDFGIGTVVPIVKDNLADATDVNITLCPTISKLFELFEYCLLHKYESHIDTSDVQFGFKINLGCSHALAVCFTPVCESLYLSW